MKSKNQGVQKEIVFDGRPLSHGVAVARVCMFNENRHSNLPMYKVDGAGREKELKRLERAVELVLVRIEEIRQRVEQDIGPAEAEIFVAHIMILKDEEVLGSLRKEVEEQGNNAESAVRRVLDSLEDRMRQLDNAFMRERATDVGEIKSRLLDALGNMRPSLQCADDALCQRGRDRIIVAEELTPSLTLDIDIEHTVAFVTERGGRNSHAAILARALGIPAVSGLAGFRESVGCGVELLVDGHTGRVVVWPEEDTVREAKSHEAKVFRKPTAIEPVPGLTVMANLSLHSDIEDAEEMMAEGVGLFRTEFEIIAKQKMLSEDEMFERYIEILKAFKDRVVFIRALDLGSDKTVPFLNISREENPSLGWRGTRLLLGEKELFSKQARALARASKDRDVCVMYPMIVDVNQFRKIKKAFQENTVDIETGTISHGVMFEVPSACLMAEDILREADFGSIGSNDLAQYLFAVDRENEMVSFDYNPDHPVFWRLIEEIAQAGRNTGKPVSICGEIAGEPEYTTKLLDAGIRSVSVSPRRIPGVRLAAKEYFSKATGIASGGGGRL